MIIFIVSMVVVMCVYAFGIHVGIRKAIKHNTAQERAVSEAVVALVSDINKLNRAWPIVTTPAYERFQARCEEARRKV